jgi:hypothetical protein
MEHWGTPHLISFKSHIYLAEIFLYFPHNLFQHCFKFDKRDLNHRSAIFLFCKYLI